MVGRGVKNHRTSPNIWLMQNLANPSFSQNQKSHFGLQIETVGGPTDCQRKVQAGDRISVHYHGTLNSFDGNVFDSSYNR